MKKQIQKLQVTKTGFAQLQSELTQLKSRRDYLITQVEERSEFNEEEGESITTVQLKEELDLVTGRLEELEEALLTAEVVDKVSHTNVQVGTKVTIKIGKTQKDITMVSAFEADPSLGKISIESPLGKALNGKKEGDEVEFTAPSGQVTYKIVEIA